MCVQDFSFYATKTLVTTITRATQKAFRRCRVRFYAFTGKPFSKQLNADKGAQMATGEIGHFRYINILTWLGSKV